MQLCLFIFHFSHCFDLTKRKKKKRKVFWCFGVCCSVWNSTPADHDRSHTSCDRTQSGPSYAPAFDNYGTYTRTHGQRTLVRKRWTFERNSQSIACIDNRSQLRTIAYLLRSNAEPQSAAKHHLFVYSF